MKKGFTLIELLVVISIIGLLSSVVLASVTSARDKAKVAAGKKFDAHTFHSFGADGYGYWNMDAITGGQIPDSLGGTITLASNGSPTVVPGVIGNAIHFDTSGSDYLVPVAASLSTNPISAINGSGGTISLWMKPESVNAASWSILLTVIGGFDRTYIQYSSTNQVYVIKGGSVGGGACSQPTCTSFVIGTAKIGEWTHVALSWSGGVLRGYLNGTKISESPYTLDAAAPLVTSLRLGQQSSVNWFNGAIDEFHIYSNTLAESEIRSLYLAGLEGIKRPLAQK